MADDNNVIRQLPLSMTAHPTSTWSESLQQQTHEAIEKMPFTPDGRLHFKQPTLGYAYAFFDVLTQDRLILNSKKVNKEHGFAEDEALLRTGWTVN